MIRLNESEFRYIAEFVRNNYGLNLDKKKVLIECRLRGELEKYKADSFGQYIKLLEKDKSGTMAEAMVSRLTTHYTYFMREFQHFELIRSVILPEVSKAEMPSVYSIWCAGCSTGQECYTLQMLWEEYKMTGRWMPAEMMLATDISESSLKQAREGRYKMKEIEDLPERWKKNYCDIHPDNTFEIKEKLRASVRFKQQNLMTYVQDKEQYDLILCRNVMIYFDVPARQRLIKELEKSLRPGGYLLVGHSELLSKDSTKLKYVGSAAYRKE